MRRSLSHANSARHYPHRVYARLRVCRCGRQASGFRQVAELGGSRFAANGEVFVMTFSTLMEGFLIGDESNLGLCIWDVQTGEIVKPPPAGSGKPHTDFGSLDKPSEFHRMATTGLHGEGCAHQAWSWPGAASGSARRTPSAAEQAAIQNGQIAGSASRLTYQNDQLLVVKDLLDGSELTAGIPPQNPPASGQLSSEGHLLIPLHCTTPNGKAINCVRGTSDKQKSGTNGQPATLLTRCSLLSAPTAAFAVRRRRPAQYLYAGNPQVAYARSRCRLENNKIRRFLAAIRWSFRPTEKGQLVYALRRGESTCLNFPSCYAATMELPSRAAGVAFSPDSKVLAAACGLQKSGDVRRSRRA